MTIKTLDFKCALITGGAGGIGKAIAEYFLSIEKKVIIAGRTESKLKSTIEEWKSNGKDASYVVLDTGDIDKIPTFIERITSEHPDIDCLVNNAGVQRPLEVAKMDLSDLLGKADNEININVRGPIHLAVGFLPHFRKQQNGAVIMNVSSSLGIIPTSIINPVYNGTKAFLHMWSMNLRTQLQQAGLNVRVVEIAPPMVGTDLHREREDPDDNKKSKSKVALNVDEFMNEVIEQWKAEKDWIGAGPSRKAVERWENEFGPDYRKAAGL